MSIHQMTREAMFVGAIIGYLAGVVCGIYIGVLVR
jgi:hypothetical protein